MAHLFEGYGIIRLIIVVMTLITVMMGFVRYGVKLLKHLVFLAVVVGIFIFLIIPNL